MMNTLLSNEKVQSYHENLKDVLARMSEQYNHTILIESEFIETSRRSEDKFVSMRLALTSKAFIIAYDQEQNSVSKITYNVNTKSSQQLVILYPFHMVKLLVFKKSKRQCIKVIFNYKPTRYFELRQVPKAKIYWSIWCRYIKELNNPVRKWPFSVWSEVSTNICYKQVWKTDCRKVYVIKRKPTYKRQKWTDKNLYLGLKREAEDQIRPRPVAGLGKTEDLKLLYLKARYFGCWEQSEHWVQCGESSLEFPYQSSK